MEASSIVMAFDRSLSVQCSRFSVAVMPSNILYQRVSRNCVSPVSVVSGRHKHNKAREYCVIYVIMI